MGRTRVLKVDPENPDPQVIREAAVLLRRGGLVAFPTETVYGLGANLQDPQAVQELYQVKQRPFEKQATLHIADFKQMEAERVEITPLAQELMRRFWPGPMTLVLARLDGSAIGFRMPCRWGRSIRIACMPGGCVSTTTSAIRNSARRAFPSSANRSRFSGGFGTTRVPSLSGW